MIEYLGNCNHLIDWDAFIIKLKDIEPMIGYQYDEDRSDSLDPNVIKLADSWKTAGYNLDDKSKESAFAWEAWYSGVHFDNEIQNKICDYLNIKPIDVSMVTRISPGRFAPWHWDIRDEQTIDRFLSYNKPIVRIHIHMNRPEPGHVFVVGSHCFYNEEQGSIYKWPSWNEYHAGANCGIIDKYQYSIIGVPNY